MLSPGGGGISCAVRIPFVSTGGPGRAAIDDRLARHFASPTTRLWFSGSTRQQRSRKAVRHYLK